MNKITLEAYRLYIKNFIFGVEDSLVSTVGLLSGVAAAGLPKKDIFIVGIVLVFVEAFSMGVGSYLSEGFTQDMKNHKRKNNSTFFSSLIMLISYFAAGFIPIFPYLFLPVPQAIYSSIGFSIVSLFLLGYISGIKFEVKPLKHGLKMMFIGGAAIIIGTIVGSLLD